MNTKIELLRFLIDTTAPDRTTVTLHYASDEPAHPVWGGGIKQKHFSPEIPTNALWPEMFGESGVQYIQWPDAPGPVAAWFAMQPGLTAWAGNEVGRFDTTPAADSADVARARAGFHQYGQPLSELKVVVTIPPPDRLPRVLDLAPDAPLPLPRPLRHVTFERHDVLSPWVATSISPLPAAAGAPVASE